MDASALVNLVDPAIVFFFVGIGAAAVRSNLEIPPAMVRFFSLYLLMAIGFKGGRALTAAGFDAELGRVLLAAVLLALLVPAVSFLILRRRIALFDAAAIAATYGSVSAVTFIAATAFLGRVGTEYSGAMTVALVVMEMPAIVMAVVLAGWVRSRPGALTAVPQVVAGGAGEVGPLTLAPEGAVPDTRGSLRLLRDAFTDGAHLLLVGSMLVGALSTDEGAAAMAPFTSDLFKGILAFFLLEMGLVVCRELRQLRNVGPFLVGFGVVMPVCSAGLAIAVAAVLGLTAGNAVLLAVLAASGSYIVVPAVLRYAIPEASASRYLGLALGVTFPFNIIVGIPLYHTLVSRLW